MDVDGEMPNSWEDALDFLKDNCANELVIGTAPDALHYTVTAITVYGVRRL